VGAILIRHLHTAAVFGALFLAAPALAGDLVVETVAPPAADAPSRGYATVFGGGSLPSATASISEIGVPGSIGFGIEFDTGYIVGGAIGTTVLPHLRGEVEFSVVKSTITQFYIVPVPDGLDSTGYNLLGNVWYDIDTNTMFMPYIGGGIGWGYDVVTGEGSDQEINTSGLLYQLGAGVRIPATETVAFDLGYRYRVQPDAKVSGDIIIDDDFELKSSATNHIVQAGVTVGF
jgi:opacity protein-like surface antigen